MTEVIRERGAQVRILGVSCDFHDSAAALLIDGRLVAAAEEERFTRRKHDASLPVHAIDSCLRIGRVKAADVEVVALYERPVTVLSRYLAARQRQGPSGFRSFVRDIPDLASRNLMIAYRVDRALRRLGARRSPEFLYVEHHRSHAAAAFFASPFETAAVLTVDGIGEWATAAIGRGFGRHLEIREELRYPDSLGLVYSFVTAYCGFKPNDDEYKVMGLAPYGTPRFRHQLDELVELHDDGSVAVRAERLSWYRVGRRHRRLARALGGPPRLPGQTLGQREADLAASVQALLEDSMVRMAEHALESTGERRLTMAGGVALNCVANGRVLREAGVEELWIQPAAGDSGSALGAALSVWHEHFGNPREPDGRDAMNGALLGPRVRSEEVASWLDDQGLAYRRVPEISELCELVARRLAAGDVVGWFQGAMEFGPRALGNRSILADPRSESVRHHLNTNVKGREDFRPFAPAVLADHASEWFELDGLSPYMLVVAPVRPEHLFAVDEEPERIDDRAALVRSIIPACTHVDGSARVQTVDARSNPVFHELLRAFQRRTGCPVLLNTSFNVAGEPIVATPEHAVSSARRAGLDLLVIEDCVMGRDDFEPSDDAGARTDVLASAEP